MKKDIEIPEVEDVHIAAVREFNEEFRAEEWNVYLINNQIKPIEMVLIVARGGDKKKQTSVMRHKLEKLPARSFAKIEFIQDEVLQLDNEYLVTFFAENKMYEKSFSFKKNSVSEKALDGLPVIPKKGVLAE
ncbi:hypothetical protein [Autumnicola musiva]|uniref:Phenylalanyl-tRNA synthetase subunit alpha n=1 Tax=Autumnicola musiva TaxID=3075589 RepID=A0ABU3D4H6_9FLAO|nr:hypothetical protein [Zunongwangia sp. F117]MDT0676436.1 hypothetical protein [Zunongwangia sp. F117]